MPPVAPIRYTSVLVLGEIRVKETWRGSFVEFVPRITLPVRGFSCRYALNDVPYAEVLAPGGRLVTAFDIRLPSPAYGVSPVSDTLIAASLLLNGKPVLNGYVVGVDLVHTAGEDSPQALVKITLRHWLGTLSHATMLNPFVHATGPTRFMLPAFSTEGTEGDPWHIEVLGDQFRLSPNLMSNLWAGVREGLAELLNVVGPPLPQQRRKLGERPIGLIEIPYLVLAGIVCPMALKLPEEIPHSLVCDVLVDCFLSAYKNPEEAGAVLWDRLVTTFLPTFFLSLAPTPTGAYLIPEAPTAIKQQEKITRREPWVQWVLPHNQQSRVHFSSTLSEPISAVALYVQHGIFLSGPVSLTPQIVAVFPTGRPGKVMYLPAPSLLAASPTLDITAIGGDPTVWPSVIRDSDRYRGGAKAALDKMLTNHATVCKAAPRFAAAMFDRLFFANRIATVSGPLDVVYSPGTQLYVPPWYGLVHGYEITFDAEQQAAAVTHTLRYCRSEAEHREYGFDLSPIYNKAWVGGPVWEAIDRPPQRQRRRRSTTAG